MTLTSWRDDTIAGDTNGDGSATGPVKGDWGGISANPAGSGNPDPVVDLDRVTLRYAATGVSANQTKTTITNSTVDRVTGDGITVTSPVGVPTVSGNTITNAAASAIVVQSANIDMGAFNGNSGSGNGLNGVQLANDTVTVSSALPWTGNLIPVLASGCSSLTVPAGVTLTLGAGTIIKAQSNYCAYLNVQGDLVANGTAASPVTLTSWRDDTIAGDTNGDGSATGPVKGDWGGISANPAGSGNPDPVVDLDRVTLRYAATGVSANQTKTTITNSTVDRVTGDGITVTSPVGVPTVSGNTITNAAASAIVVQSANIDMGALNGNSGSGNGLNGVQLANDTVTVSSALPWTGNLIPVLASGCSSLTVPAGVTLTLGAGTIIKAQSNYCAYLNVQGDLVANGTAASPVTLTSWRDDTIAGDTNGDGNATLGAAGDWGGITIASGASASLGGTTLRFAATALAVTEGGQAQIAGKVLDSTIGVSSYEQIVDARNVDWGSASGPAPVGTGTRVVGSGVVVTPWVGYVEPPRPAPGPPQPTGPTETVCQSALFIGARGSGEGPQGNAVYEASTSERALMEGRITPILDRMKVRLGELAGSGTPPSVREIGLRYPALPVPAEVSWSTSYLIEEYLGSIWTGVYELIDTIADESARCPSERIVLAGYSQGALVVHLALAEMANAGSLGSYRISAVELVADPGRRGDGSELRLGEAPYDAQGVYDVVFTAPSIPSSLNTRTATICHKNDAVCDTAERNSLNFYALNVNARGGPHTAIPSGMSSIRSAIWRQRR